MTTYKTKPSKYGPLMTRAEKEAFEKRGPSVSQQCKAQRTRLWGVQEFREKVAAIKKNQEKAAQDKSKNRKVVDL